jgi:hypothetical protein
VAIVFSDTNNLNDYGHSLSDKRGGTAGELHSPYGLWVAILLKRVLTTSVQAWIQSLDELQGQLLRRSSNPPLSVNMNIHLPGKARQS